MFDYFPEDMVDIADDDDAPPMLRRISITSISVNSSDDDMPINYYIKDSGTHGKGSFAKKNLNKDDIVGALGYVLTWTNEDDGEVILLDDAGRFTNYDKEPNAYLDKTDATYVIRAKKKIAQDDEILLSDHYREEHKVMAKGGKYFALVNGTPVGGMKAGEQQQPKNIGLMLEELQDLPDEVIKLFKLCSVNLIVLDDDKADELKEDGAVDFLVDEADLDGCVLDGVFYSLK